MQHGDKSQHALQGRANALNPTWCCAADKQLLTLGCEYATSATN